MRDQIIAIDWYKDSQVSKYFTVNDCIYLPRWNRKAIEGDGLTNSIRGNLIILCNRLDAVRDFLGKPMVSHVTYRPPRYNEEVGGAPKSFHTLGLAMDFHVTGQSCDSVRDALLPKLQEWALRMEDLPSSGWVHLDAGQVPQGGNRFFKP